MEMENTTTIDVLEYAVKMAEKGRNILAQSRGEEMTFTDESVFEATDTVLHPTGSAEYVKLRRNLRALEKEGIVGSVPVMYKNMTMIEWRLSNVN